MCGCGQPVPIATYTSRHFGWVKGEPKRFVSGHNARKKVRYKAEDRGYTTPCWIWQLYITPSGYGHVLPLGDKQAVRAHRYYHEQRFGSVPDGYQLDHLCEVRCCVNPDHLQVVTPAENSRRSRATKLTWEAVKAIRNLRRERGLRYIDLAKRFGVSQMTIADIIKGRTWIA